MLGTLKCVHVNVQGLLGFSAVCLVEILQNIHLWENIVSR